MGAVWSYVLSFLGKKERRILILGLDNAGKTTILYRLQVGEVVTTIPTIGFNVESVKYNKLTFQLWDLGGQSSIRPYWRCYYANTDVIIYVVDSMDRDRMVLSSKELQLMLKDQETVELEIYIMRYRLVQDQKRGRSSSFAIQYLLIG
ncbi:hypothetical protein A3Q56_01510, partial [Intoshia linei]